MKAGLRSWPLRNMATSDLLKVTLSASRCHSSTTKPLSKYRKNTIRQNGHHMDGIKRHIKPNTSPHPLAEEARQQRWATHMPCTRTWPIKPIRPDRSMDPEAVPRHEITAMKSDLMNTTIFGISTDLRCHPISAVMSHGRGVPHTPCALPMR